MFKCFDLHFFFNEEKGTESDAHWRFFSLFPLKEVSQIDIVLESFCQHFVPPVIARRASVKEKFEGTFQLCWNWSTRLCKRQCMRLQLKSLDRKGSITLGCTLSLLHEARRRNFRNYGRATDRPVARTRSSRSPLVHVARGRFHEGVFFPPKTSLMLQETAQNNGATSPRRGRPCRITSTLVINVVKVPARRVNARSRTAAPPNKMIQFLLFSLRKASVCVCVCVCARVRSGMYSKAIHRVPTGMVLWIFSVGFLEQYTAVQRRYVVFKEAFRSVVL